MYETDIGAFVRRHLQVDLGEPKELDWRCEVAMAAKPSPTLLRRTKEDYGELFSAHLFEQYRSYVESAERISERRISANNYLLTVNASLVTLLGLLMVFRPSSGWMILISVAGILVSLTWHRIITSYRDLNTIKFAVIHEIEEHVPLGLYSYEWHKAEEGKGSKYHPLSHLERWIPIAFMVLYVLLMFVGLLDRQG